MNIDFASLQSFLALISQMKKVQRWQGRYWDDYGIERNESVPDHIWRMLMMLLYLDWKLGIEYDLMRVIKIILVHDMAEIKTGDMSAANADSQYNAPETKKIKEAAERQAMTEIFAWVAEPFASDCLALWEEYEARETSESKVAQCIDKLEAFFHALETSGAKIYPEHYDFCLRIIESQKGKLEVFDVLFEQIKQEFIKNYKEFSK